MTGLTTEQVEADRRIFASFSKILFSEQVRKWFDTSGFLTAPASTKYHGAYEGGLLHHSLGVMHWMAKSLNLGAVPELKNPVGFTKIATVSLLHDICKADAYEKTMTRVKTDDGWEDIPSYRHSENAYPMGHGEKSLDILSELGVQLTRDERLAIRWHMGAYNISGTQLDDYSKALRCSNLLFPLHTADMMDVLYGLPDLTFLEKFLTAIPF